MNPHYTDDTLTLLVGDAAGQVRTPFGEAS